MCTVSFIPVQGKVFITHNRDEKIARPKALYPNEYNINGHKLLFPRDTAAGGSWFAMNQNGAAAVLLNGGYTKHVTNPPYRKSRGLVFLDIVASDHLLSAYQKTDLANVEPFTVILWNEDNLFECRWDGTGKYIKELDITSTHIWSSVTLYEPEIISRRQNWFRKWLQKNNEPVLDEIIQFHLSGGEGDEQNDLRMNRDNEMLTVSVTGMEINSEITHMKYLDLRDNVNYTYNFPLVKAVIAK